MKRKKAQKEAAEAATLPALESEPEKTPVKQK